MFMENLFMRECSTWNDKWENKKQNNVGLRKFAKEKGTVPLHVEISIEFHDPISFLTLNTIVYL